jgi:hypothetical protein
VARKGIYHHWQPFYLHAFWYIDMFLFSLVEGMFSSSMVYNAWAMMLLVSLYPGCRFLKNSWLTGPSLHSVPNSKSQNLASISVHFYLYDYLFWDSWTNFLACVTVPGVLQYAYITWYESKWSSLPFLVPWQHSFNKRECWRIYICSLCTLLTLKENGWRGICYFSGPEFLFCKILF